MKGTGPMIQGRLRRLRGAEGHKEDQYIEIDPGEAIVRISADLSHARAEAAA